MEPLYEELKKIYDWNEEESKNKPRIKGDQRMYYEANDKLDPTVVEQKDQLESPEIHADSSGTYGKSKQNKTKKKKNSSLNESISLQKSTVINFLPYSF